MSGHKDGATGHAWNHPIFSCLDCCSFALFLFFSKAALVSLALYVLQHPDTRAETKVLAKKLVKAILDDPDTVLQVGIVVVVCW